MNFAKPEKIVVLGLMSHFPVAGVVWQTIHYLIGLQRLGYDVYYVEAHGCSPTKLMHGKDDDGPVRAAAYVAEIMKRFGLGDRWAYDTRYQPRRVFGMTELQLKTLYTEAAVLLNLSGSTLPLAEHSATNRLVYLETDPVDMQIDLCPRNRETDIDQQRRQQTIEFLNQHFVHFSFGENFNAPDCQLPVSRRFRFLPTRQPVVIDFWKSYGIGDGEVLTTVGNWNQPARGRRFRGEWYHWSKHLEFMKFIDLPSRTAQPFELALSSYEEADREMLEKNGWRVRRALDISGGLDFEAYRDYVAGSRGEFTVAKDQNIRLRSGWFSDRAATYLAAGRPVITQETGFSTILPTGEGLFAFSSMDEILAAVEAINSDYAKHRRAALEIAREYFSHDVVLARLLKEIGAPVKIPSDLVLSPTRRWPTRLADATVETVNAWSTPIVRLPPDGVPPKFSIITVVHNGVVYTRMCLTSVLLNTRSPHYELIVVDNASTDETPQYLQELAALNPHVRVIRNTENRGFAAANNQGLAVARGEILILLNNDTIVTSGWVNGLARCLTDSTVGLAGPVTNRTCNEAQIDVPYRTYGELLEFVRDRARQHANRTTELHSLAFFCVAMRRGVFERLGRLDERFGLGSFEDCDYSKRAVQTGLRLVCTEDTFVHHFGQGTIGELAQTDRYDELYERNRRHYEEKWGAWEPPPKRITAEYEHLRARIREMGAHFPENATVAVISKGDDQLLRIEGRRAWHFPQASDGTYPYIYPADSADAIRQLEVLRSKGASHLLLPRPGFWWLDHYADFAAYLGLPAFKDDNCMIYSLDGGEQILESRIKEN